MGPQEAASEALRAIDSALSTMSEIEMVPGPSAGRFRPLCSLLITSVHHARAAITLVASDPQSYFASSTALYRCQIEAMVRGYFFAYAATDREFKAFVRKGRLPKRPWAKDSKKLSTISLKAMHQEAAANMGGSSGLESILDGGSLEPFHESIHSGRVIMLRGVDLEGNVGLQVPPSVSAASLSLPLMYAHAALVHLASRSGNSERFAESTQFSNSLQRIADIANGMLAVMRADSKRSTSCQAEPAAAPAPDEND